MFPVLDVYFRTSVGKNQSRQIRNNGFVPAVIYGYDKNVHLHKEQISWLLRHHGDNTMVELNLDNNKTPALIKEVQRHPISGELLHVDFKPISLDENIKTKVPINFTNSGAVSKRGGIVETYKDNLEISCKAQDMPKSINVDTGKYKRETTLKVRDIEVSDEISIIDKPERVIAVIGFYKHKE